LTKIDQNLKERVALLSVYDKSGIVEFAKQLARFNFKIYASGGTFKTLQDGGVESSDVAGLIGGGAILGHRVVTLSREIYAGLLARNVDEDIQELKKLGIPRIDLVCVDLYPLEEEIGKWQQPLSPSDALGVSLLTRGEKKGLEAIIEKTDIGGPTLLRAAAKGRRIVIADAADRQKAVDWLKNGEPEKEEFLSGLAAKAEYVVANYALISAKYHSNTKYDGIIREQISESKYGENAWQVPAGLFGRGKITSPNPSLEKEGRGEFDALALENFRLLAGTPPSYNNWADVDRMLQTVTHIAAGFDVNREILDSRFRGNDRSESGNDKKAVPYLAVGVKHGNACGAAIADDPATAIQKMLEGDLRAIFGGLVMVNFDLVVIAKAINVIASIGSGIM
jgi:phosphoribosylaminoimidazolecarboxamide formyltransferase/IMP cyclohydrolase